MAGETRNNHLYDGQGHPGLHVRIIKDAIEEPFMPASTRQEEFDRALRVFRRHHGGEYHDPDGVYERTVTRLVPDSLQAMAVRGLADRIAEGRAAVREVQDQLPL